MKICFESRNDEDEEEGHDRDREDHDDDRIDHRGDDLVLDLLGLLLEFRQTREHELEDAAKLAGAHHVHVEIVEDSRMLREPFRKRAPALHRIAQTSNGALENFVALLFREHGERAQ